MQSKKICSRIVVKVGSSLLGSRDNHINLKHLRGIVNQLNGLLAQDKQVVLVSSGAIACGMSLLKIKKRPKEIAALQATAAIGQNELMAMYRKLLKKQGRLCAQVLLTWDDFEDRRRYLNVRQTVLNLLENKVLPVINENDTVDTDEIRFGDNDKLSALVANLIAAELLIILSDVEGLYRLPEKKVIKVVDEITPEINRICCNTDKQACVGGMSSKIEAVKIATGLGIPAVIASGKSPDALLKAVFGEPVGTFFPAKGAGLKERKRWIAYGVRTKGTLTVDDGAKNALVKNGKSLLSVGITGVKGNFAQNETVSIVDRCQNEFARGKVNFSARELEARKGLRHQPEGSACLPDRQGLASNSQSHQPEGSGLASNSQSHKQEVVHRDNLVIL